MWVLYILTFCILCPLSGEPSRFYMGSSYQPLWFPNELYFITSILMITPVVVLPVIVVAVVLHNLFDSSSSRQIKRHLMSSCMFTWSSIEGWFLIRNDCQNLGKSVISKNNSLWKHSGIFSLFSPHKVWRKSPNVTNLSVAWILVFCYKTAWGLSGQNSLLYFQYNLPWVSVS